jgi:hypothetical protein
MNRETLQTALPAVVSVPHALPEEALIDDVRAGVSPAQAVERKLIGMLQSTPMSMNRLIPGGLRRSPS